MKKVGLPVLAQTASENTMNMDVCASEGVVEWVDGYVVRERETDIFLGLKIWCLTLGSNSSDCYLDTVEFSNLLLWRLAQVGE